MSQPRPLHVPFTSSFLTRLCESGLGMPGNMALKFLSSSEQQKMPTRKWSAELAPEVSYWRHVNAGKPKMPDNLDHEASDGKEVWHSHFGGILELVPSAEALHHRR